MKEPKETRLSWCDMIWESEPSLNTALNPESQLHDLLRKDVQRVSDFVPILTASNPSPKKQASLL